MSSGSGESVFTDSQYVEECYDSPVIEDGESPRISLHLRAIGYENETEVFDAISSWQEEKDKKKISGLECTRCKLTPIEGTKHWDIELEYSDNDKGENSVQLANFQFSTTGETVRERQGFETMQSVSCNSNWSVVDFRGGIGWSSDGGFEGCDVFRPKLTWTQDRYFSFNDLPWPKVRAIGQRIGTVNSTAFNGCQRGEVLFTNVSGGLESTSANGVTSYYWKLTYAFAFSPNMSDLVIGSSLPFAKNGWDYLWVLYARVVDDTTGTTVETPVQANVEMVYPYTDLNDLDLSAWGNFVTDTAS